MRYIKKFSEIDQDDVAEVGGKNASLGEMIRTLKKKKIRVPSGFATTAEAYREFVDYNDIEKKIKVAIDDLVSSKRDLKNTGKKIRSFFYNADFPEKIEQEIGSAYNDLSSEYDSKSTDVAVRSSATAEDLPEASFAGQQETFLNVKGKKMVVKSVRKCFASLFTDRAISYRQEKGFDHLKVALSSGIQKMVRSDKAGSGVMFTIDTETGFPDVIIIDASWGLGEFVVKGVVNPDEYIVFKPLLGKEGLRPIISMEIGEKSKKLIYSSSKSANTKQLKTSDKERKSRVLDENEILMLAEWGKAIEKHYGKPMDIEWAKDGETDELFIVQARPETVQSQEDFATLKTYKINKKGKKIITGQAIGDAVATARSCVIKNAGHIDKFSEGSILVTGMTDPDWVPIMKKAKAIVTDHGGRTSHAAIVSRELGIPAIVGSENGTKKIKDNTDITVSCAEGEKGFVYEGRIDFEAKDIDLDKIPETNTKVMINIASPVSAFRWWMLPNKGIGLARMEFIINNVIKVHPMALAGFKELKDKKVKKNIEDLTSGYKDKKQYFIEKLAMGISKIAASTHPYPTVVRMSDFKTNEYADLLGGSDFEIQEENPMLGFRGASRYYSDRYIKGFNMECKAIKRAREYIGLDNIIIMIPFCRTLQEADKVIEVLNENGLGKKEGAKVYIMAEIPSNIVLAEKFAERFDGFSIGSNDLTQLVLGVDRDSEVLSGLFNENDQAVKTLIKDLIREAHKQDTPVGICGQAPSDHPEFTEFLVENEIDSISLNPDSFIKIIKVISKKEKEIDGK